MAGGKTPTYSELLAEVIALRKENSALKSKFKIQCDMCSEFGHIKEDCPKLCTIKGCDELGHSTKNHYCEVCDKTGVSHIERDCPEVCTVKGCEWQDHSSKNHYCEGCDKEGVDHIEKNCPSKR